MITAGTVFTCSCKTGCHGSGGRVRERERVRIDALAKRKATVLVMTQYHVTVFLIHFLLKEISSWTTSDDDDLEGTKQEGHNYLTVFLG
jgi:hypothetical protein